MKVKRVLEELNNLPLEEELVIQWYRKEDVESNKGRKISPEAWEHITQWAPDYISEEDFGISALLERAEQEMYKQIEVEFGRPAVSEVKSLITQLRKQHLELNDEFYRKRMQTRREWGMILVASAVVYGIFKLTGVM